MMTIVTHAHLKERAGREWDAAMRTRLSAAKKRPGWVGGQLLRPSDKPDRRVIVGTWRTRADWEAWHQDPQFAATRQRLDGVENGPAEHWWHDVELDVRKYEAVAPSGSKEVLKKQTAKSAKPKGKKKARRR
jgi:heme-degrading monooxygenase HmoA